MDLVQKQKSLQDYTKSLFLEVSFSHLKRSNNQKTCFNVHNFFFLVLGLVVKMVLGLIVKMC